MRKIILLTPLVILAVVCLFFLLFILFDKNPSKPPSALLDKKMPFFSSTNLYNDKENLVSENLKGKYILINFFASWCTPCRAEHHLFFEIKKTKPELFILGFAHKDEPHDSKKYLEKEGNPYSYVGIDQDGKIAFEFGVFGLPETFVINNDGQIIFRHIGPLTEEIINNEIAKLF